MIGVYKIECLENYKSYIGSSVDVSKRLYHHKCTLKNGLHDNKELQTDFNKYGIKSFSFTVIKECSQSDLQKEEQVEINKTQKGYNKSRAGKRTASRRKPSCNTTTNITIPEETYIKVVKMAEKEQRSFSNMVSIILSKEVDPTNKRD